ncbi:MAG: peptide deformylase [Propionibacteriaceae bacterium]|jgi:peptide deformylase|nr:peptide deformylase [Propionibacteriaceae bacterium]
MDAPDGSTGPVALADLLTGGAIRRITRWGEEIMHRPTTPVTVFDAELHDFLRDMFATMDVADGVGLAATQVDDGRSCFVFRCPDIDGEIVTGVVCNPVVVVPQGDRRALVSEEEGCLSLPGAYESLARPDHAICRGFDHNGDPIEIVGTGMLARCLQHETDHLNGIVFGDRLSTRRRKHLYAAHDAIAYRYPDDWPVSPRGPLDPVKAAEAKRSSARAR